MTDNQRNGLIAAAFVLGSLLVAILAWPDCRSDQTVVRGVFGLKCVASAR